MYKYIHHTRLINELYLFWLFITLIQLLVELAGPIKPMTFCTSNRFSFNFISPVIIETVELQFHSCKNQRVTVTIFFSTVLIFYLKIFIKSAKKRKERVVDISTHQENTKTNLKTPFESQDKISSLEFPNLLNFHFIENRQKFIGFCLSFCFSFKKARTAMPLNYKWLIFQCSVHKSK